MTLIECIEFYQSRIIRGDSRKKAGIAGRFVVDERTLKLGSKNFDKLEKKREKVKRQTRIVH